MIRTLQFNDDETVEFQKSFLAPKLTNIIFQYNKWMGLYKNISNDGKLHIDEVNAKLLEIMENNGINFNNDIFK